VTASVGAVIGATGGIGGACARSLASGADAVVLAGRNRTRLEELAEEIGATARPVVADLARAEGRDAIVSAVAAAGGEIRWLVVASGMPLRAPLASLSSEQIAAAIEVNLLGPALLIRSLLDLDWGRGDSIIVIGSISAARALPNRAVYGATKAGIEQLARALAVEVAPRGIRINVVAPGVVDTPFLGEDTQRLHAWVRERVPAGRLGAPDDVARVVHFVALEAPEFLTGARIVVDGGVETSL
jgi:3-oxoacyl-[acyl-carrier protein] reductase